jgi:uncharacterized protein (TIGR03083 family)
MTEPDDSYLQPTVAAELTRLADLLDAASEAQWDTASLCAGWRVREVVAHMTMAARYPEEQFTSPAVACRRPTWTGRSARARCCAARPPTSRWSSAVARSRPSGSKALRSSRVSRSTKPDPAVAMR